jgi:hypothetical protein
MLAWRTGPVERAFAAEKEHFGSLLRGASEPTSG